MTHQPHTGHRAVIQAALDDYWLTTDLMAPFDTHDVTAHIETYLISSGYTITPDIPRTPMPTRTTITVHAVLIAVVVASAISTALRGDWLWTTLATALITVQIRELLGDLAERRHRRNARPIVIDRPTSRQP
jgi:hypothetical protein